MSGFAASRYAGSRICDPLRFAPFLSVREKVEGVAEVVSHPLRLSRTSGAKRSADPGSRRGVAAKAARLFLFKVDRADSPHVAARGPEWVSSFFASSSANSWISSLRRAILRPSRTGPGSGPVPFRRAVPSISHQTRTFIFADPSRDACRM